MPTAEKTTRKFKFEDKNGFQGQTHYPVANESCQRWKEVLKNIKVKTAGGIAGGGEISLFGILPSVSEKLVLVDHSYISLWALIGKFGTIEKLGAEKAVNLMRTPAPINIVRSGGYNAAGRRVKGGQYNQYGEFVGDMNPYSHLLTEPTKELYACFLEANKGLVTETDRMEECGYWPLQALSQRWQEVEVEDCEALLNSKVELQVCHGDISDLTEHAPLELLYLSNALQYAGRNGKEFKIGEIVEKGAYIAYTGSSDPYYGTRSTAKTVTLGGVKCTLVSATRPSTPADGSWTYSLAQVI